MRNRSGFTLFAAGLLLLAGAAGAQEPQQIRVDSTAPPVEATGVDMQDGAVLLTLDEAVEIALRQNLGLSIQRFTRNRARLAVGRELGIYDLRLSSNLQAEDAETPAGSQLEGSQTNIQRFNAGFDQLLPLGGNLDLGWTNTRREDDNPFSTVNPSIRSGLRFGFNQPLLRDFGRLATERNLLVARNRSQASREDFERLLVVSVQDVIDAYWNLVGARQQLIVAEESMKLARELHDRNRIQVEVGTMAPLELVQSEAAIAEREEGIITSQSAVGDAEDVLRRLLNLPEGPLWSAEIRPATDPAIQHTPIDVAAAIQTALAERPEVRFQQLGIEQAQIETEFARNQERPTLDLDISYGFAGLGGDLLVEDPVTGEISRIPGGFGDALSGITGLDFPGWSAELIFGFPLQNRTARAARAIAEIDLDRAETAMEDVRSGIVTEVRGAARRVETAAKQIDAAKASRVFQERNLDAERKRYENGMSTSFQITQIQEDLTEARSREVNSVVNYRIALAEYQRVIGRLLEEEGVAIDDEELPIDRWQFSLSGR